MRRSVSTDLELDAGTYSILMKITAKKYSWKSTTEQVIQASANDRQDKLIQIGLAYDLAHAKGHFKETEAEKQARKEREERKKAAEKQQRRKDFREQKFKEWQLNLKQKARDKRHAKRKEEHHRRRAEAAEVAKSVAAPNGTASDGDPLNHIDTLEKAPGANGNGQINQDMAPPTAIEPEAEGSELEAAALSSSPVNPRSAEHNTTEADSHAEIDEATAHERSQNFHIALQSIPSVLVNGSTVPASIPGPPSTVAPPSTTGPPPLDSDYDSDASFDSSIDSDLDFPPSPIMVAADTPAASSDPATVVVEDNDDEFVEFENDPWNAVCVVGLRVYSKNKETCVQVVRPKEDDEEESPLDVDDVSKGVSGQKIENQVTEEVEQKVKEKLSEKKADEKTE